MTQPRREDEVDGARDDAAQAALDATVATTLRVLRGAVVAIVLVFLGSGIKTVGEDEVAFVRRFGRVQETVSKRGILPTWPVIDEVQKVRVNRIEVVATDAFSLALGTQERLEGKAPERKGGLDPSKDGYLVTGDRGIVHARPAARWRVQNALDYSGRAADPAALVRVLLERAAARSAASRPADELILLRKEGFVDDTRSATQEVLRGLGAGIEITGIELEPVEPGKELAPAPQVRQAFQAVQRAQQDRGKRRSEARAEASDLRAKGLAVAARVRAAAESEARRVVADAIADASIFKDRLVQHRASPRTLRERLLAEALEEALGRVDEAFVVKRGAGTRVRLERDSSEVKEELDRRFKEASK